MKVNGIELKDCSTEHVIKRYAEQTTYVAKMATVPTLILVLVAGSGILFGEDWWVYILLFPLYILHFWGPLKRLKELKNELDRR